MNLLNFPSVNGLSIRMSPLPPDAIDVAIARKTNGVIGQNLDSDEVKAPTQKKRNWQSNPQNIQSVFQRIDILTECNLLLVDTIKYLHSIKNESCKNLVCSVIASIEYTPGTEASQ